MRKNARDWVGLSLLLASVAYFVWSLVRAGQAATAPHSHDTYAYYYPIMILAARAVWHGGSGLFWNPFQNCGQPLFGVGHTGLLYPPGVLSLVLPPDQALHALLFFNLAAGGVGAYFLCRELGVNRLAAWCGALTFTFSTSSIDVITWTPLVSCPYTWFPAAMLFCERILREPTVRRAAALGVTLALSLIMGHQQVPFYLYQLLGLRVLWELVTRGTSVSRRSIGMLAAGLTLGPLFSAIQLMPAAEVMLHSIRNTTLEANELQPYPYLTWESMRGALRLRSATFNPFMLVPYIVGSVALLQRRRQRHVLFYALAGLLSLDLAMGPNGWLFPYYTALPLGKLFRGPGRLLWVNSFCVAMLVGYGVDALTDERPSRWAWRIGVTAVPLLAAIGFFFLVPNGWNAVEWRLVIAALIGSSLAVLVPRIRPLAGMLIAAALLLNLVYFPAVMYRRLMPGRMLFTRAELFHRIRERMSAQDRVYLVVPGGDFSFQQKTGSLFGVPAIFDYDSLPTLRYAAFFTMLRTGSEFSSVNDWIYPLSGFLPPGLNRRLLNLTAAHYLVVGKSVDRTSRLRNPPVRAVISDPDVTVYENTTALPRAFYVPRIEVVADPAALLSRLANGADDLREVALVEEDLASGFRGAAVTGEPAHVELSRDDPEHIELQVYAPSRGFVFLADQYYPGWVATVNGAPTPVARANYAFRLVEVPPGESVVQLRYRPLSVRLGALISAVSVTGVGLLIFFAKTPRRPRGTVT